MSLIVHFRKLSFANRLEEFAEYLDDDIKITIGEEIPQPAEYELLVYPTPSEKWLKASPNLRAVIIPWAGIPGQTRNVIKNFPQISLHNLHHNNFNTAELGFALLLAAAKCIVPLDKALRKNDWSPRYEETQSILLRNRTALILGFGEIGQALATYCLGFGMRVLAIKKHPAAAVQHSEVQIFPPEELVTLLPKADVLLIALPLTDETRDLIGKEEIAKMPEGSLLVNIGRGPIVDQHALYTALVEGPLRAAASDVWYNYPESEESRNNTPPADVPFGDLDNFVLSPHRGGLVEEVDDQRMQALADLLNAANRGEHIPNKVDLDAGY